jgi:hypothetical protein
VPGNDDNGDNGDDPMLEDLNELSNNNDNNDNNDNNVTDDESNGEDVDESDNDDDDNNDSDDDNNNNKAPRRLNSTLDGPHWDNCVHTQYCMSVISGYGNLEATLSTPQYGFQKVLKVFGACSDRICRRCFKYITRSSACNIKASLASRVPSFCSIIDTKSSRKIY